MPPPDQFCCEIPLTQGQVARVSSHRYGELSQFKWSARWCKETRSFYALRNSPKINGKSHIVSMQRHILGLKYGDKRKADHCDHDTLNNQDDNLRIVTPIENGQNKRNRKDSKTGYKGVDYHAIVQKYRARITIHKQTLLLGYRHTAKEAYEELYAPAALRFFGKFAHFE